MRLSVFVSDKDNKPRMPCTERRARLLLERGTPTTLPRSNRTRRVRGLKTGDMVRAELPNGERAHGKKADGKARVHVGRVAVRASGSFNVQTPTGVARHCKLIHRADGYRYQQGAALPLLARASSLRAGIR